MHMASGKQVQVTMSTEAVLRDDYTRFGVKPSHNQYFANENKRALPIPLAQEAMAYPAYGSKLARALKIKFCTGCRNSELDRMHLRCRLAGRIKWKLGKNQKGRERSLWLPRELWIEIEYGMQKDRHRDDLICDIKGSTFTQQFDRYVRPNLSAEWQEKVPYLWTDDNEVVHVDYQYKWQLHHIRNTFATLTFAYFYTKFLGDVNLAFQATREIMGHTTDRMTKDHYLDLMYAIDALNYIHLLPFEYLQADAQAPLIMFMHMPGHTMDYNCTGRPKKMEKRDAIAERLKAGATPLVISKELHVPRTRVYRIKQECDSEVPSCQR